MKSKLFKIVIGLFCGVILLSFNGEKNYQAQTKKTVALTFDDGPTVYTPKVLAVLEKYAVKATFFMTGRNVSRHPEYVRLVYAQGHQIANHTWSHPFLSKLSHAAIVKEMNSTNSHLENIICGGKVCAFKINYMRPPYGNANGRVRGILSALGFRVIGWNIVSNDYFLIHNGKGAQAIVDSVFLQKRKDKEVVLFHDGGGPRQAVVDALPAIIEKYIQLGYQFVRADEK